MTSRSTSITSFAAGFTGTVDVKYAVSQVRERLSFNPLRAMSARRIEAPRRDSNQCYRRESGSKARLQDLQRWSKVRNAIVHAPPCCLWPVQGSHGGPGICHPLRHHSVTVTVHAKQRARFPAGSMLELGNTGFKRMHYLHAQLLRR